MTDPQEPRKMGDPHTLRQGLLPWANPIEGQGDAGPGQTDTPIPYRRRESFLTRVLDRIFGKRPTS
jgi:hypothetical protein